MQAIASALPSERRCVQGSQLGDAQRAMLDYYTGIRVVQVDADEEPRCDWALTQGSRSTSVVLIGDWTPVWEGARPGDNFERLRLYRLNTLPAPLL